MFGWLLIVASPFRTRLRSRSVFRLLVGRVAAGRVSLSGLRFDRLARGRDDPPGSAEVDETLALDLASLLVLDEVIERVAAVGDLQLPVPALGRAEQRGFEARANGRLAGGQRRPVGRALSVARALLAFVGGEQIER